MVLFFISNGCQSYFPGSCTTLALLGSASVSRGAVVVILASIEGLQRRQRRIRKQRSVVLDRVTPLLDRWLPDPPWIDLWSGADFLFECVSSSALIILWFHLGYVHTVLSCYEAWNQLGDMPSINLQFSNIQHLEIRKTVHLNGNHSNFSKHLEFIAKLFFPMNKTHWV